MGPSLGGALVSCVKRAVPETKGNWHRQTTHSTVINVVAVVPPPAGISQSRRRTLPGNVLKERVGSSRAHSRNYHNWKRTPSVTNRSPRPMEDGMRFHVVCLSFHHIRLGGILVALTQPRRKKNERIWKTLLCDNSRTC